jgi:hypothetical protein
MRENFIPGGKVVLQITFPFPGMDAIGLEVGVAG